MNDRMCIVTRAGGSADDLLRFVCGPEGDLVPDLKRQLPGRGCWVTAERAVLETAIKRKLFARALKCDVVVPPDLPQMVDRLLTTSLTGMMALARKAGQFVGGSVKIDKVVRSTEALAVFHTADAAADGIRKIDQARKATALITGVRIPAFRLLDGDEMADSLGDGAFKHTAALAGQAGDSVVKRAKILARYRQAPIDIPDDGSDV